MFPRGRAWIAVLRPLGVVVAKPIEVSHTAAELGKLADFLKSLDGETRVVMEYTGRYYEPVAQTPGQDRQGGCEEDRPLRLRQLGGIARIYPYGCNPIRAQDPEPPVPPGFQDPRTGLASPN